jgi:hypothetical protein
MKVDHSWRASLTPEQIVVKTPDLGWAGACSRYRGHDGYRAILFDPGEHHFTVNQWVNFVGHFASEARPLFIGSMDPSRPAKITRDLPANAPHSLTEQGGRALFNVVLPYVVISNLVIENTGPVVHMQSHHHHLSDLQIGSTQGGDVITTHDVHHQGGVTIERVSFGPSTNWIKDDGKVYHGGAHKIYIMLGGNQKYPVYVRNVFGRDGTGYLLQVSGAKVKAEWLGAINTRGFLSAHTNGVIELDGGVWVRDGVPETTMLPKQEGEVAIAAGGGRIRMTAVDLYLQHKTAVGPVHGFNMDFSGNFWHVMTGVKAQWDDKLTGADATHSFRFGVESNFLDGDAVQLGESSLEALIAARSVAVGMAFGDVPQEEVPEEEPNMSEIYVSGSSSCLQCKGTGPSDAPPIFPDVIPEGATVRLRQGTTVKSHLFLESGQKVTLDGWPGMAGEAVLAGNIHTDRPDLVHITENVAWEGGFIPIADKPVEDTVAEEIAALRQQAHDISESVDEVRQMISDIRDLLGEVFNR